MASILRSRLALFGVMGIFLIPIQQANLGGLTHVLTCRQQVDQPFTVVVGPKGEPQLLSSIQITRESDTTNLCGGLTVNPAVSSTGNNRIAMTLPIQNDSAYVWRGTITLRLDETEIPIGIGEVPAGEIRSETVRFRFKPGTFQLNGALSVGP